MLAALKALGLFSFLAGGFEDGEGVSQGDICGERSELISMLRETTEPTAQVLRQMREDRAAD